MTNQPIALPILDEFAAGVSIHLTATLSLVPGDSEGATMTSALETRACLDLDLRRRGARCGREGYSVA